MFTQSELRSYIISSILHFVVLILFLLITLPIHHEEQEFVTVGFGSLGNLSSSGKVNEEQEKLKENLNEAKENVNLPKTMNKDVNEVLPSANEKKNRFDESIKSLSDESKDKEKGREFYGEGTGKFGFDIDFGGQGMRRIYSYVLPQYPEGVNKEIDLKLRFTILADGTVGNIVPLIKADTRLEDAAIKSLRQWRFEPLSKNQKSVQQTAVIIFPFRLQ